MPPAIMWLSANWGLLGNMQCILMLLVPIHMLYKAFFLFLLCVFLFVFLGVFNFFFFVFFIYFGFFWLVSFFPVFINLSF